MAHDKKILNLVTNLGGKNYMEEGGSGRWKREGVVDVFRGSECILQSWNSAWKKRKKFIFAFLY